MYVEKVAIDWSAVQFVEPEPIAVPRAARPTIAEIQRVVAHAAGITVDEIKDKAIRPWRVSHPRQIAITLSRELTGASFPAIGRKFGNMDHTTCLFACRRVKSREAEQPAFAAMMRDYRDRVARTVSQRTQKAEGILQ